ncbi:MAG TPA: TrpB-like pyridoxal phosphate-dependent enzyme [Lentisphaeria bacterium]|nr:MAG: TrpB-like pyridoxal-phosphate dependent enzyme [Lentisphaerae bacterium GWF2_50_93]HCE46427.1 TrpB-like pyridoxal phosphate-dependent enzyme [Lentisphaeria bacterium]
MAERIKIVLDESEIPREWYNIQADLPNPMKPPLHPGTLEPIQAKDLEPIFPMNLIEQEVSRERWIKIPEPVMEKLALWRPSPLYRAVNFEKALGTKCKIYYKNEGVSPAGSHKPNSAIPQAYYNKIAGIKRLTTETGAGQWGSALSMATQMFGLELKVYMVRISFEQKPFRKIMMETWGAKCVPSPSMDTEVGRTILKQFPDTPGSLGIAISEAIEDAISSKNTRYSLGSVLNFVCLHQTVIGLEAQKQMKIAGEYPDIVIGCVGGGSNFAGIAFPYVCDKIHGKKVRIVGVEPTACPSMTKGQFLYDFGDMSKKTPLMPMHTLGHGFVPAPMHAGGLRYHGLAPLVSQVLEDKLMEATSVNQLDCYKYGVMWARSEGFIPAPETTHAIAAVAHEAKKAEEEGKEKSILFCWSGHGLMDLAGYEKYFSGKLTNYHMPTEEIKKSLAALKGYPKP